MHFCTWLLVSLPSFAFLNAHSQFKLLLHIQAWRSSFLHFHSIWSFIYSFWTFWFLHLKMDAFTSSSSFYSSVPFKLSCHLSVWTLWFLFQVWTYVLLSNFEVICRTCLICTQQLCYWSSQLSYHDAFHSFPGSHFFLLWFTFNFWCPLLPSQVCTSPFREGQF